MSVRLSGCLSLTRRYCVETDKRITTLFFYQLSYRRSHNSTACSGFKRDWAAEKEKERRFSTIKSLYLVNDSRSAYIYTRKSHMGFQLVPISITLNDRNAPSYTHSFSGVRCMKTDPYCQRQKGSPGSVNEFVPTSIYGSKGSSRGLYRSAKFCCNRFGGGSKFVIFNWLGLSPLAVALYYVPRSLWRRWRRRLLIRIYARCNDWQNSLQLRPYSFCIRHYCVMWRRKTCDDKHRLTLSEHIKSAEQRTIIQQYGDWYTGRWWVGCYIWCSEDGPAQSHPRCTKCTSPPINCHCTNFIILMWHYNCLWTG